MKAPVDVILPGGTTDLARALGEHGLRVHYVANGRGSPARFSKFVASSEVAGQGARQTWEQRFHAAAWPPGAVVIPSTDQSAWALAAMQADPASALVIASPGPAVMREALVKYRLYRACAAAGVAIPRTWLIDRETLDTSDLRAARFPLLIKAQTRVGMRHWFRGRIVRSAAELETWLRWFQRTVRFEDWMVRDCPDVAHPMVQEFAPRPGHEVYQLAGYRSAAGESVVAAHVKVLQYPLKLGTGACFESTDVRPELAAGLERLFARIGFHGIFEVEFVERDGEFLLIDLNPRPYNGIGLEVARGYALPWYLYLEASGQLARLSEELSRARTMVAPELAWCDSPRMGLLVAGQTLSGGLRPREGVRWLRWYWHNRHRLVDPNFARGDLTPGFRHLVQQLAQPLTDPNVFFGTYLKRGLDS
jgi:predicted ATP-grasp superfamily ATP-dependent carboligase